MSLIQREVGSPASQSASLLPSEWQSLALEEPTLSATCADFHHGAEDGYELISQDWLNTSFVGNLYLSAFFAFNQPAVLKFYVDDQLCNAFLVLQPLESATDETGVQTPDHCSVATFTWPAAGTTAQKLAITAERQGSYNASGESPHEPLSMHVVVAIVSPERATGSPATPPATNSSPSDTHDSGTVATSTRSAESSFSSSSVVTSAPTPGGVSLNSSSSASSKARIIVPCVVVPVVVILLAILVAFLWRRRTRTKMAPSAAFKMENPTFTPGETWVPIDEKRAFSPGPTKVGSGSSL